MTSITWTHREGTKGESWNPITGCTRVSPGCENCYAETLSHRAPGPLADGQGRKKRDGALARLDGRLHTEWPRLGRAGYEEAG